MPLRRQWIGAIEIGYVLDALLGVQHKVLSVGSGDDMPSLARQIAHHFDTQGGPPVMPAAGASRSRCRCGAGLVLLKIICRFPAAPDADLLLVLLLPRPSASPASPLLCQAPPS